jgi:hypothetical protein
MIQLNNYRTKDPEVPSSTPWEAIAQPMSNSKHEPFQNLLGDQKKCLKNELPTYFYFNKSFYKMIIVYNQLIN